MIVEQTTMVALTIAIVQITKGTNVLNERYYPALAVLIGLALNLLYGLYAGMGVIESVIYGLMIGTAAAGTFDFGKKTVMGR